MKIPIPADWDGESWHCVQVQWPDSTLYNALLSGFLSYLMRGRYWDERTGSVLAAQLVGREIWERNTPFKTCEGTPIPPTPETIEIIRYIHAGGPAIEDEAETMPCIALDELLKIENGHLWARNSCCEWVDIGALVGPGDLPADLTPDQLPPDVTDYSCRKAYSLGQFWEDVALAVISASGQDTFSFAQTVRSNIAYTNWSDGDLFTMWANAALYEDILPGQQLAWTAEDTEQLICLLRPQLSPTTTTLTESEWNAALNFADNLHGWTAVGIWKSIFKAAELKRANRVIQLGLWNDEADCSCPETIPFGQTTPSENGWYLSGYYPEKKLISSEPDIQSMLLTAQHDVYGVVLSMKGYSGGDEYPSLPKLYAEYNCDSGHPALWDTDTTEHEWEDLAWGIDQNAFNEVLGAYNYNWANNSNINVGTLEAPNFPGPDTFDICVARTGASTNAYARFYGIRLLHNINSPSHQ